MPHDLTLAGCAPAPIAGYLEALGVLRLVAEQVDGDARGCWAGESFVLQSRLQEDDLRRFLLEDYRPSPIVAPWNGGSGFYPKDNRRALEAISAGTAARLAGVRDAIAGGQRVVARFSLEASPKDDGKAAFLAAVRAELADEALAWIDAAVLLGAEDPRYPPLLGTGGNDGRLDFTNNFLQRLVELIDPDTGAPGPDAATWLEGALFGTPIPGLLSCAIGQLSPGAAGGPNASTGFGGGALVNPWDFVLALEGALLLTATATRRLEAAAGGALSYPFTVRPTGAGSGAADLCDEQPSRGEIWLPVWRRPATYREIAALFREGRATVGRRTAADGFDFRRAVAALGVDRGIDSFARFGFNMRAGRAFLAMPLGRIRVEREARDDLLVELDRNGYLDSLRRAARRDGCPAALRSQVRGLEEAVFKLLAAAAPRRPAVQQVLTHLGEIERLAGRSAFARDSAGLRPAPWLSQRWAIEADDGSDELRLAAALASLGWQPCPFRVHVGAVGRKDGEVSWEPLEWKPGSAAAVFTGGVAGLVAVLDRRLLPFEHDTGHAALDPLDGIARVDLDALAAFSRGAVDLARLAALAAGLSLVRIAAPLPRREPRPGEAADLSASLAALAIAFSPPELLSHLEIVPHGARVSRPRRIVALLRADRAGEAAALAWQSLRLAGMHLPLAPPAAPAAAALPGRRLAGALLFSLEPAAVATLARRLSIPQHGEQPSPRGERP